MSPAPLASRPVPRAGACLLLLAGIACLALGGYLAGTATFGADRQLVFLNDARTQRDSARVDEAAAKTREIKAIQRRGGPPAYVARSVEETSRYFDELREARDEILRVNAQRWRRTQWLLGGWLGLAGLALLVTGVRQWRQAAATS